jgi:hypothetical protein
VLLVLFLKRQALPEGVVFPAQPGGLLLPYPWLLLQLEG